VKGNNRIREMPVINMINKLKFDLSSDATAPSPKTVARLSVLCLEGE
jgi:hypothetical protein